MDTTRQRILEQFRTKRTLSAGELSLSLGTTSANIRHHLSVLLQEGVIEIVALRSGPGRGRPASVYALTQQIRSHNLDGLARALLDELLDGLSCEERLAAVTRLAERLAGQGTATGTLTQRLNACVRLLHEMNYEANWEAYSSGPRLVFHHCPYASILPQHPELCEMDSALLEGMVDTPILQVARLSPNRYGDKVCVFNVQMG